MTTTFTTEVPDVESLDLDGSEPDQITAQWNDILNNGEYRLEVRESDANENWGDSGEAVVAYNDPLEETFINILDGEQYDVRIRAQTQYVIGTWLEGSEITNLPAPSGLGFANVGQTSLDVQWTDNATFEGSYQIFRKRADWDGSVTDDRNLRATESSTTEAYNDPDVSPGREYEYVVRARTSWVHADTSIQTVETQSTGLPRSPAPARGWHVEINNNAGQTLSPDLLDDAKRNPAINGLPRVELPVRADERWQNGRFDDIPANVWHDGEIQPVERIERRRNKEGKSSSQTVLEARGGIELENRVVTSVDAQEIHLLVEDLLSQHTSYTVTVDNPDSDQRDTTLQSASTSSELEQALKPLDSTDPFRFPSDDTFAPYQTAYVGTQPSGLNGTSIIQRDDYISGEGFALTRNSDEIEFTFDLPYENPDPVIWFRYKERDDGLDHHPFILEIDGTEVVSGGAGSLLDGPSITTFSVSGSLAEGSHTVKIRDDSSATAGDTELDVDMIAVVDGRYNYTQDETLHEPGGHIDGPELYPDQARKEMEVLDTPLSITDLTLDVQTPDGALPELALGENGTTTYNTASETTTHSISYTDTSTTARGRIAVGRDEDVIRDTATPRTGYEPRVLDALEMTATLDDTPVVSDRSFDDTLLNILKDLADIANAVFEVRTNNGEIEVVWTQLGQRTSNVDPDVVDYEVERQTEDLIDRAIVYGGAQRLTRQSVTVQHDTWVDLPFEDSRLVDGKEVIYDGGTEFERGQDYEIRYTDTDGIPKIKALSGGSMTDGQTVDIDADVKPRGEFQRGTEDDPRTRVVDMPELATKQMCDQVAVSLVEETEDAVAEVRATVPHDAIEWSVVEAIDPDSLPGSGPYQTRNVTNTEQETVIEFASRLSLDEIINVIGKRTRRNSQRL